MSDGLSAHVEEQAHAGDAQVFEHVLEVCPLVVVVQGQQRIVTGCD